MKTRYWYAWLRLQIWQLLQLFKDGDDDFFGPRYAWVPIRVRVRR